MSAGRRLSLSYADSRLSYPEQDTSPEGAGASTKEGCISILPTTTPRSDAVDATMEAAPSLELARTRATEMLPRDPATGLHFDRKTVPRPSDFEFLGLGVYSYIAHLHRLREFFLLAALLSVSSIIANGHGKTPGAAGCALVPTATVLLSVSIYFAVHSTRELRLAGRPTYMAPRPHR